MYENDDIVHRFIDLAGNEDILQLVLYKRELEQQGIDVNTVVTGDGYTALIWCLSRMEYHLIEPLLTAGFDIHGTDIYGSTFFHWSVYRDSIPLIELGIRHGGDINIRNSKDGRSLLHKIIQSNTKQLVLLDWLLGSGADVDSQDNAGITPLMECILAGDTSTLRKIMENDPDLSLKTKRGQDVWQVAEERLAVIYADTSTATFFLTNYTKEGHPVG